MYIFRKKSEVNDDGDKRRSVVINKKRPLYIRIGKWLFWSFFIVGVVVGLSGGAFLLHLYFRVVPDVSYLDGQQLAQTTIIYDRTGEHILYELFGEKDRKVIPHEDIPDAIRLATIAAEDDAFYSHFGVDIPGVVRSAWVNFQQEGISQGGSTITMQLARNVFLSRERTMERKLHEAVLAVKIENSFSKDEILDWYLNIIPYGSNAYGVEAAAQTFFGKSAKELTYDEAALLASLPKATTDYSPYGNNVAKLQARQKSILNRMHSLGFISSDEFASAQNAHTLDKVQPLSRKITAPHFVFAVLEELEREYGREFLETGGFHVYTTIDLEMQRIAEEKVRDGVAKNAIYNAENAALVAISPKTGEILTMVGSRDYFDKEIDGQVNVATSLRQPGSTFKPIAYARAFELGFQPETLLFDVKTSFGIDGSGKDYSPNNYDYRTRGLVSMRQALANSLNIPAVKTLYLGGVDGTIDLAKRLGITSLTDRNRFGLALVLGGGEVTLTEITSAFGVFAHDGVRNEAHSIVRIVDNNGKEVPMDLVLGRQVVASEVARKVNSILADNNARSLAFGTRTPLFIPNHTVAAKTGTTQEYRDGWTIGYTPSLAVGVWAGNNNNSPMKRGNGGLNVASPIWNSFMIATLDGYPERFPEEAFTEYRKIESDAPMIAGKLERKVKYYDDDGDRISESKALKKGLDKVKKVEESEGKSILNYIINGGEEMAIFPYYDVEMMQRWDDAVRAYENR